MFKDHEANTSDVATNNFREESDDHDNPQRQSTTDAAPLQTRDGANQTSYEMQDIDEPTPPKPTPSRKSLLELMNIWRWEVFTWCLGTLGLLANLILVAISDGPLQRNWHSKIQITAFVAALTQVSQSALLVPTASSIAQLKWKHMVSLGAICTVLLLGFPTFIQQAVQIGSIEIEHSGNLFASVPRAVQYRSRVIQNQFYDELSDMTTWFTLDGLPDLHLKDAIEAGLLAANVTHDDVRAHCQTDKCSWVPYKTLAVCSKVEDAADMIVFDTDRDHATAFDQVPPYVPVGGDNFTDAGYTIPKYTIPLSSTFLAQGKFFFADEYHSTREPEAAKLLRQCSTPISSGSNIPDLAQIYITYFDPCLGSFEDRKTNTKLWKAHKATFNLCLQTHSLHYDASGLHTNVVSQEIDVKWDNSTYKETEVTSIEAITRAQWCAHTPPTADVFCIPHTALMLIGGQLVTTLDIKALWGAPKYEYYSYSQWAPNLSRDILGPDPGICSTDADRGFEGFKHRMDSLAISLTNAFRISNGSVEVSGTASTTEPTIEVNYMWLILPCALYIAITGLFITTVVQTRHLPPWKSSALALLWGKEFRNNQLSTKQIKIRGKQAEVQLVYDGTSGRVKGS
ncbi:hypothetical protein E8E11_000264 [Didymella keratinophila]|nr:hypothetical protein E8E11_000264 [Didymella keratinophila]